MNKSVRLIFVFIFFVQNLIVLGQEDFTPCKCCFPELRKLFHGEVFETLWNLNLTSSFLVPTSNPPKKADYQEEFNYESDYQTWSCQYSIWHAMDGDPKTAWVEGVDGSGRGEVIILSNLDLKKPVKIWAGYGKSGTSFSTNNRPKKIRVVIIRTEGPWPAGAQGNETIWEKPSIVNEAICILVDKNDFQPLNIPDYTIESYFSSSRNETYSYTYLLGIEILDIYRGSKYDDTCISEVANE